MLKRIALRGALRLEEVVVHGPAVQEALLRFRDPMLQEVVVAELNGGSEDPVARARNGERARILRG
eukprot:14108908-Alexandrium_andersonii.AAC.1